MAKITRQQTVEEQSTETVDLPIPAPAAQRHVPDHPSVTPELRRLVDAAHGTDFAILSAGKERAYIENKARGFDILVATGVKA